MPCAYLTGRQIKMCNAVEGALVLSLDELKEKCLSNVSHACEIYERYHAQGLKMPLREYRTGQPANKY